MTYESVDQLQKVLANQVFHYTKDAKKASGRALGTLVEIITFYLLKSWGLENSIAIERQLAEYGNPDITHNVEYSLHPILRTYNLSLPEKLPITSTRLLAAAELVAEIVNSNDIRLLRDFILTVGVVSNHGNWFTSDNYNKELKVLAQSYDWLIFLTDRGLAQFIQELLLEPKPLLKPARNAFMASYTAEKKKNLFTKVQMNYAADQVLQSYFQKNLKTIEKWFNIIAPTDRSMQELHTQISQLCNKNWQEIYSL